MPKIIQCQLCSTDFKKVYHEENECPMANYYGQSIVELVMDYNPMIITLEKEIQSALEKTGIK